MRLAIWHATAGDVFGMYEACKTSFNMQRLAYWAKQHDRRHVKVCLVSCTVNISVITQTKSWYWYWYFIKNHATNVHGYG